MENYSKSLVLSVFVVLIIVGTFVYFSGRNPNLEEDENVSLINTASTTSNTIKGQKDNFVFEYHSKWYLHDKYDSVILLKVKEFPQIESESYAFGDQITLTQRKLKSFVIPNKLITKEEFIDDIKTQDDDGYEGKATLIKEEKNNGLDMLRVEHRNEGFQPTVAYYVFKDDNVYTLRLYPYRESTQNDIQNYNDFMGLFHRLD